jgi:hypothetical protein
MPDRPLTLSAVVAHLRVAREASNRAGVALRNGLKDQHVTGFSRTFSPRVSEGGTEEYAMLNKNADEYKAVPIVVEHALAEDAEISAKSLDWAFTQDLANCAAQADVIVNGETLLHHVPISSILMLVKFFDEYKAVILTQLPILDPSRHWDYDEQSGIHRSRPEKSAAVLKQEEPVVSEVSKSPNGAETTKYQRANREVRIGDWTNVIPSGAVTEVRKRQLLRNADTLLAALKEAAAVANHTPAQKISGHGEKLFGFLLGQ